MKPIGLVLEYKWDHERKSCMMLCSIENFSLSGYIIEMFDTIIIMITNIFMQCKNNKEMKIYI